MLEQGGKSDVPKDETAAAQEAPEAGTTQPGETQEQQQQEPQYVTKDDLDAALERERQETLRQAKKSSRDQIRTQLQQYNEAIKLQKDAGFDVPPEAQKAARDKIIADGLAGVEAEEEGTPPASGEGMTDAQWGKYVLAQVDEAFQTAGQVVKPSDPEWKEVEQALTDPNGNLTEVILTSTKAAETKKARVTSDADKARARTDPCGRPRYSF